MFKTRVLVRYLFSYAMREDQGQFHHNVIAYSHVDSRNLVSTDILGSERDGRQLCGAIYQIETKTKLSVRVRGIQLEM